MVPDPPRRRRRSALLRGLTLLPGASVLVLLRALTTLLWPVAAVSVLARARVPRWWRSLAGRTLRRATRQRAHTWLLSDVRSGVTPHPVAVHAPALGAGVTRRSLAGRVLLSPLFVLERWVLGTFAAVYATIAWVCLVAARRHPARLCRAQYRVLALCGDIDAYMLLLVPARPRLPEVDPRLAPAGAPTADHAPLPPWPRRTGRLAVGLDLFCGLVVVGAVAGFLEGAGADLSVDLGAILALDLLVQTLAPLMGFYLAASEAPLTVGQLGLHVLRPWRSAAAAFGLIGSYVILLLGLAAVALPFTAETSGGNGLVPDGTSLGWTLTFIALATVIAPVFEEIFYRGIMFQALRARRGTWTAAVISSVFFAIAHLEFDPVVLIDRSLIGIGLCYLFARTGRLLPGMFAHSINNAIVAPLAIGWTWQVPAVVVVSLLAVLALAALVSSRRGTWNPMGLVVPVGLGQVAIEPAPPVALGGASTALVVADERCEPAGGASAVDLGGWLPPGPPPH
ncbi:MAG: family intrarane metalloprotease [Solirubrobacterales bacterium]|nr:family intrarane metalloprotease [Solirubrobacterales bacterium]